MKLNKYIFIVMSLFFLSSLNLFAQDKEEMTEEQWQTEMTSLRAKKESLNSEIQSLNTEIANLKNTKVQSYDDCISELYAMVGATSQDVSNFKAAVIELQNKINSKEGSKADRQKDLDALKMNKISALPDFYATVHKNLQYGLDSWIEEPKEVDYTVVKGDCLWNIAKKKDFYGNGFAWPNIYNANRDKIKNPDLIFPKQVFKIPKLTDEEKAKYDKIRMNYKPAPAQ